jgi:hypothetical protein
LARLARRDGARRLAIILSPILLLAACSSSDDDAWRGYYYANVLSNDAPLVNGPYGDGPQCVAAMHAMLRQAPSTAGFTCAHGCRTASNGVTSDCKEAMR